MVKHFKTISEFLRFRELPVPGHPLIGVVNVGAVKHLHSDEPASLVFDFYSIAAKRTQNLTVKYGQQPFDFNEGILSFTAPGQVISLATEGEGDIRQSGWVIFIHPDFLWNTTLAKTIKQYEFWRYSLHEALFLSEKEEMIINQIIRNMEGEIETTIDKFSKPIIIAQIESLLSYAERFYNRQFITREKINHQVLDRLETVLNDYFNSDEAGIKGLPTVQWIAGQLNISPPYLSSLLKAITGQTTQQHIHDKLIEKAKEELSATDLSVSEIAYRLGFEHLPSFSKLFKAKTQVSPVEFRQSFH